MLLSTSPKARIGVKTHRDAELYPARTLIFKLHPNWGGSPVSRTPPPGSVTYSPLQQDIFDIIRSYHYVLPALRSGSRGSVGAPSNYTKLITTTQELQISHHNLSRQGFCSVDSGGRRAVQIGNRVNMVAKSEGTPSTGNVDLAWV